MVEGLVKALHLKDELINELLENCINERHLALG